jgi:transposase-like protein
VITVSEPLRKDRHVGRTAQCGPCAAAETAPGHRVAESVSSLVNVMMSAQANQVYGADYGERSDQRVNQRNGYRARERDTRVGTVECQQFEGTRASTLVDQRRVTATKFHQ